MHTDSAAEHITSVIETLSEMSDAMVTVTMALEEDKHYCVWAESADFDETNPRQCVIKAVNQIEYLPEQDPRSIIVCPGIVGASEETLTYIQALNEAKLQFKKAVVALKDAKIPTNTPLLQERMQRFFNKRDTKTQMALEKIGFQRLHLKQCYRQIPCLESKPKKISWTWANTRSIKKISIAEAQTRLLKKGNDVGIQMQLRKLAALNSDESLAIVQELAPHLRANIVYADIKGDVSRQMIKGPMPIFFPADEATSLPQFKPPKEKQAKDKERVIRKDTRLDPEPYLPAIRAHRYLS